MTITIDAVEGTQSVSTTEWSMTTDMAGPAADTTEGVFQAFVDLSNMAAGDTFRFAVYETVETSAGTQRLVYTAEFTGAQASPIWSSPALILGVGWDMTLLKVAGTDRTIVWRIAQSA